MTTKGSCPTCGEWFEFCCCEAHGHKPCGWRARDLTDQTKVWTCEKAYPCRSHGDWRKVLDFDGSQADA